jgi:hypothetical protein
LCPGRCRGAATLSRQENNKAADVQRKRVNFSPVLRLIIRARVIMAAVNCSPAVVSRRAKYVDEFRAPTLLGAQPRLIALKKIAADAKLFSDGTSGLHSAVPAGRLAITSQIPENRV